MNIGTPDLQKIIKIGAQCSEEEKKNSWICSMNLSDVFSWSYEDLRGFDPNIIQHAIPIKEEEKPVRKNKDL
jgi:hypothetical protein